MGGGGIEGGGLQIPMITLRVVGNGPWALFYPQGQNAVFIFPKFSGEHVSKNMETNTY